ncbi:A-kinase anchor protein 14 isoform X1 [Girardinichthys multiradiatus]|uniref:A-kinase anchor protein 14 isoform X1 n=1 Tax=Girardinichthys multiradiatus TaxID=208333 RepID=UPI001FABC60A|nr:A-kinase anchor protein 14 isoform X1 [Girardinichthys multiradiatus]
MERYSSDMNEKAELSLLIKALREDRLRKMKEKLGNAPLTETDSFEWATSKDFNIEVGRYQIEAYIKTWEIRFCWVCSVNFLRTSQEDDFMIYFYEARFMAPTARKPISDRVSVYFAAEVSKTEAEALPVEVRFILESRRLVHTPGRSRFCEKWLTDITETKALLQRMMDL